MKDWICRIYGVILLTSVDDNQLYPYPVQGLKRLLFVKAQNDPLKDSLEYPDALESSFKELVGKIT